MDLPRNDHKYSPRLDLSVETVLASVRIMQRAENISLTYAPFQLPMVNYFFSHEVFLRSILTQIRQLILHQ